MSLRRDDGRNALPLTMSRALIAVAALVMAVVGACGSAHESTPASTPSDFLRTAEEVRTHVTSYFASIQSGDSSAIAGSLADDYRLIGVSGALWNRGERLRELTGSGPAFGSIVPSEVAVRLYGATAVVTGLVTIVDKDETIHERFTQVWVQRERKWQQVSGQITAVTAPDGLRPR